MGKTYTVDKDDVIAYLRKTQEHIGYAWGIGVLLGKAADAVLDLGLDCIERPLVGESVEIRDALWARTEEAEAEVKRLREMLGGTGMNPCPYRWFVARAKVIERADTCKRTGKKCSHALTFAGEWEWDKAERCEVYQEGIACQVTQGS